MPNGLKISFPRLTRPPEQNSRFRTEEYDQRTNRRIASMCEHLGRCSVREKRWPSLIPLYVWLGGHQEREKGHPNPTGSPMGIPIRWEPGNRGKTPDRAVSSLGHLGYLIAVLGIRGAIRYALHFP